jgi:hypothetical protein
VQHICEVAEGYVAALAARRKPYQSTFFAAQGVWVLQPVNESLEDPRVGAVLFRYYKDYLTGIHHLLA